MIFHDESRNKIIPFELVCRRHRACTGFDKRIQGLFQGLG